MLRVQARKLGTAAILCLQGRVVQGETGTLRNAVQSQSEASAVVLDLARVSTIDAGGLGLMLELREQTQSKGIAFRLINVTRLVRRIHSRPTLSKWLSFGRHYGDGATRASEKEPGNE